MQFLDIAKEFNIEIDINYYTVKFDIPEPSVPAKISGISGIPIWQKFSIYRN
jgi:hypothetical protein